MIIIAEVILARLDLDQVLHVLHDLTYNLLRQP